MMAWWQLIPDVIDPLDALISRMRHGSMHRFTFDANAGFTGAHVESILRKYGIRIYGREMNNDEERAFLVKQAQASWAEYVLLSAGVPLTSKLVDKRNAQYQNGRAGTMPTPWGKGVKPKGIAAIVDAMAGELGLPRPTASKEHPRHRERRQRRRNKHE